MKDKFVQAYMDTALRFAELSSATRLKVGSLIVKDHRILSIGYNGMPAGWDNECERTEFVGDNEQVKPYYEMLDLGFTRSNIGWTRTTTKPEVIHAEANAIIKLARDGQSGLGSEIFITHAPCIHCAKMIYGAGISKVYYKNLYRTEEGINFLKKCEIFIEKV
jgi:dCMP deaminase